MPWIYIMRFSYFKIFSVSFVITVLSPEIATSINIHGPFFIITDYDVRFIVNNNNIIIIIIIILSVRSCWFHNMITFPSWLVSADFGTWYMAQCLLSNFYNKQIIIIIITITIAREGQKLNFLFLFWLMVVLKKSKARVCVLTPVLYLFT